MKNNFLRHALTVAALSTLATTIQASNLNQYTAAIHVHSTFSNGHHDILELARFARERNVDVLVVTDSFLTTVEYGLWPLDRIALEGINKRVRPAVRDHGIRNYLTAIEEAGRAFPELVLIAGVEAAPCYYWTGVPWDELTLHDFDRHLLVLGLGQDALEHLPVIGNATWKNTEKDWGRMAPPAVAFSLGVLLLFARRRKKIYLQFYTIARKQRLWVAGLIFLFMSGLLAWNNYPFGTFCNPYSNQNKIAPYQGLIDYVETHGGLVFWSYPEARYPPVREGRATLLSRPHPDDLLLTDGYHGFEGIYGDRITATLPGQTWDLALMHYLYGKRKRPPYAISGIDFHYFEPRRGRWYDLDGGQTIVMAEQKSQAAVLNALRTGRFYATFQERDEKLRLRDFHLETAGGRRAIQGEETSGQSPVRVHVRLDWLAEKPEEDPVFQFAVIRNGKAIEELEQSLPIEINREYRLDAGRYYFRLHARSRAGYQVLSNPVFVTVQETGGIK